MAPTADFSALPPELVHIIDGWLDLASKIALRITCKSLHNQLPKIKVARQLFATDICCYMRVSSHTESSPDCQRCAMCHGRYPLDLYTQTWTPEIRDFILRHGKDTIAGPGMISIPSDICDWHRRLFARILSPKQSLQYFPEFHTVTTPQQRTSAQALTTQKPPCRWVREPKLLCMHCHTFSDNLWRQSCPKCVCQYCGVRIVQIFTRLAGSICVDWVLKYVIIRDEEVGMWFVKEWHKSGGQDYFWVEEM
jgi:hypothetical protein